LKFSGVTILQGVEFPIFLLIFEWALQQCSATALPVIQLGCKFHWPPDLYTPQPTGTPCDPSSNHHTSLIIA